MQWNAKDPAAAARWHKWYAWYPVTCEGRRVWLETVERRYNIFATIGGIFLDYEYRFPEQ